MKKKIITLFCTIIMMCACLCGTAFAENKPDVELMYFTTTSDTSNPYYRYAPVLYYRNNTEKTIKYLDWYVTAYNRVGDPTPDLTTGLTTRKLTVVGPIQPFQFVRESNAGVNTNWLTAVDSPFRCYKETAYFVSIGNSMHPVYQDIYNNFFVEPNKYDVSSYTYLTEDEIQNAMFSEWCGFDNTSWYSNVIDRIQVDKVIVTYMDGSTETIANMGTKYRNMSLQNLPFDQMLAQCQAVYNYKDYLLFNPDLTDALGTNQKALFEHFISSGMKEGRQGSSNFNLDAYKANNPDLVAAFGNDNIKYYDHYIASGKAEGRIAK